MREQQPKPGYLESIRTFIRLHRKGTPERMAMLATKKNESVGNLSKLSQVADKPINGGESSATIKKIGDRKRDDLPRHSAEDLREEAVICRFYSQD